MARDNGFTFGDKSTWDFPIMNVEKYPASYGAVKKYTAFSVPGRNGDLHIFEGAFENYVQPYECYYHTEELTNAMAHKVKQWLLSTNGYQRLTDVYDPEHFRLATVLSEIKIENCLNKYGRFTVNFNCDPRSFLLSGLDPISFASTGELQNDYFPALPLITVYGSGDGTVSVGDTVVKIIGQTDTIVLDCDLQNAYHETAEGVKENRNSYISVASFPKLLPGVNAIGWTGGVERLEIIPRWWTI